ncbi:hypothetical protein M011DRAFT_4467 [Sporormia fimetaria CBS 119925]|uniref:Uncharacterized protein n=1 Tax=Sporormia fimetaria CBS 119925 TaxID=1340428 RepID=A0A6A6VQ45_9PLEO|nr:hypothetical protein M011DRAFT_4467 [Sporormia fimetaria CBS 119925]
MSFLGPCLIVGKVVGCCSAVKADGYGTAWPQPKASLNRQSDRLLFIGVKVCRRETDEPNHCFQSLMPAKGGFWGERAAEVRGKVTVHRPCGSGACGKGAARALEELKGKKDIKNELFLMVLRQENVFGLGWPSS